MWHVNYLSLLKKHGSTICTLVLLTVSFKLIYILNRDSLAYYDCRKNTPEADKHQQALTLPAGNQDSATMSCYAPLDSATYIGEDIHSNTELFYYAEGGKVISVVFDTPQKHITQVRIYSIPFPPAALANPLVSSGEIIVWLLVTGIAGCFILVFYLLRGRRAGTGNTIAARIISTAAPSQPLVTGGARIFLFGQFAVTDKEGNNISRLFTPLVRELFLLLLLHSLPGRKGITSEKINELLWPGRAPKDAKNNRSVNIVKLRNILDKLGAYSLEKEDDRWGLHFDGEQVNVDLLQYLDIAGRRNNKDIPALVAITARGAFLAELEYHWLDEFKSDMAAGISALFLNELHQDIQRSTPEHIIAIANCILNSDPLSEDAIIFKCRALVAIRQHAAARTVYNNFAREYMNIYGESFDKEYQEILAGKKNPCL